MQLTPKLDGNLTVIVTNCLKEKQRCLADFLKPCKSWETWFFSLCTESCLKMKMTSLQVLCKLAFSVIKMGSFKTLWESLLFSTGDKSADA